MTIYYVDVREKNIEAHIMNNLRLTILDHYGDGFYVDCPEPKDKKALCEYIDEFPNIDCDECEDDDEH